MTSLVSVQVLHAAVCAPLDLPAECETSDIPKALELQRAELPDHTRATREGRLIQELRLHYSQGVGESHVHASGSGETVTWKGNVVLFDVSASALDAGTATKLLLWRLL